MKHNRNTDSVRIDTHSLSPLLWVAHVPCKRLVSAALFIWSYHLEPVQSPRSSNHVRLGLPLPRLPFSLPSIIVSRVSILVNAYMFRRWFLSTISSLYLISTSSLQLCRLLRTTPILAIPFSTIVLEPARHQLLSNIPSESSAFVPTTSTRFKRCDPPSLI